MKCVFFVSLISCVDRSPSIHPDSIGQVLPTSLLRFSLLRLDKCCLQAYFDSACFDWTSAAYKPISIHQECCLQACFRIWTSLLPANMFRLGNIASFEHRLSIGKHVCFDPQASIWKYSLLQSQASIWPCSFLRSDSLWSTGWTCDFLQGSFLRFTSWTTKPFEATYLEHTSGLPHTAKLKPVVLLCSSPAPACH